MPEPRDRAVPDEPRSPWLRGGFVLAAAFVGFVTVIGAAIAVGADTPDGDDPTTTARTPGARATAPAAPSGADCPALADDVQDVPATAPTDLTWTLYGSVALPASEAAGPAVTDGDVARCYARTPLGALLATSQISVRYLAAGDWLAVTRAQTVGAGRDAYLAERRAAERTAPPDAGARGAVHGQIAGFRFVTYHDTTAVIQTVWRFPDGRMQAATTTVLWRDGDWRLEYPADPVAPTPVDSLAGYTEWGGV
ncbi:hypothetical protein [Streptomyces sp. NPDC006997]|uniref:hypothetical protein n=1 Tax=Streptomyces sp. NPDC006997 TaxID=3155356 RepID=UPI0033D57BC1